MCVSWLTFFEKLPFFKKKKKKLNFFTSRMFWMPSGWAFQCLRKKLVKQPFDVSPQKKRQYFRVFSVMLYLIFYFLSFEKPLIFYFYFLFYFLKKIIFDHNDVCVCVSQHLRGCWGEFLRTNTRSALFGFFPSGAKSFEWWVGNLDKIFIFEIIWLMREF